MVICIVCKIWVLKTARPALSTLQRPWFLRLAGVGRPNPHSHGQESRQQMQSCQKLDSHYPTQQLMGSMTDLKALFLYHCLLWSEGSSGNFSALAREPLRILYQTQAFGSCWSDKFLMIFYNYNYNYQFTYPLGELKDDICGPNLSKNASLKSIKNSSTYSNLSNFEYIT